MVQLDSLDVNTVNVVLLDEVHHRTNERRAVCSRSNATGEVLGATPASESDYCFCVLHKTIQHT